MSKVVRVAVVGYGGMGGWHTKRLQEIPGVVELAGVYDIKPERNKVAEENGIHAYSSFEELLASTRRFAFRLWKRARLPSARSRSRFAPLISKR